MFDPVPKFKTICDHYKERIIAGQLSAGDPMPSVREVAVKWKCAPATAARAMRELQSEGYAYTVGQTTVVADRRQAELTLRVPVTGTRYKGDMYPPPGPRGDDAVREPVGVRVTEAGVVVPPEYVTQLFVREPGSEVVRSEAVTTHDSRPVTLTVRWYPPEHQDVPGILETGYRGARGPAAVRYDIEQRLGYPLTAGLDSFHGRTADEREARLLRIAVGTAVLARVITWAGRDGVAEYVEAVYPPGVVVSMEYLDSLSELGGADSE